MSWCRLFVGPISRISAVNSVNRTLSKTCYTSNLLLPKRFSSKIFDESDPKTVEIKKELTDLKDKQYYSEYFQEETGWVYAKKPHKYLCKEGKAYLWCSCGRSHRQVCIILCDRTEPTSI